MDTSHAKYTVELGVQMCRATTEWSPMSAVKEWALIYIECTTNLRCD